MPIGTDHDAVGAEGSGERSGGASDIAPGATAPGATPRGTAPWGARPPSPLGDAAAIQSVGETAAPLLAGFGIALVGVVGQNPDSFRAPGAAMVTLIGAAFALLFSVQASLRAKQHFWTRADWALWYPEGATGNVEKSFQRMHGDHIEIWATWRKRTEVSYNVGVLLLGCGVALVAAPPHEYAGVPLGSGEWGVRLAGAVLALLGVLGETVWWFREVWTSRRRSKR